MNQETEVLFDFHGTPPACKRPTPDQVGWAVHTIRDNVSSMYGPHHIVCNALEWSEYDFTREAHKAEFYSELLRTANGQIQNLQQELGKMSLQSVFDSKRDVMFSRGERLQRAISFLVDRLVSDGKLKYEDSVRARSLMAGDSEESNNVA